MSLLLFVDDAVMVVDSREKLLDLVTEFAQMFQEKGLKINPDKSKVMKKCTKST